MAQKEKILIVDDGHVNLNTHVWNDPVFCQNLVGAKAVDHRQAKEIVAFIRSTIDRMDLRHITSPMVDEMVKAKLAEYGLDAGNPIRLTCDMFVRNGLDLADNAHTVLERRYLKKDRDGTIQETPAEMFHRVARHIARAELNYDKDADVRHFTETFYALMTDFRFLPNSPTLMNAGRRLGQLAACFVLPIDDSMEGIFDSLKNAAIIHKSGGGTGFSFSRLRPKNSMVGTTGGIASGPISFMKIFNTATEQVKQGGTRRGANMAILRVDHPDIMEFIHCKTTNTELNNFNISVGITETFMNAVKDDVEYDLMDPRDHQAVGALKARDVYEALVEQAWKNGDPGIVFLDRINRDNPTPALGDIESTNPCGEQPLLPMEACNLGSINLSKFVVADDAGPRVDYTALKTTISTAVRFLDNTIDMSRYPLEAIDRMVKGNRKIGLGIMGFADLLFQLQIPYNSEKALEVAEELMAFIQRESHQASLALAQARGPFPNYEQSRFSGDRNAAYRNATTTTIAPTGTLSIISNCSSGIEPLFALSFVRTVMDDDKLMEVNPHFEAVAKQQGFYSRALMETVAGTGSIAHIDDIPDAVKQVFVTAHDISPEWHLRMQAAFQKHTDNAVSKTVNLSRDATVTDVRKIYDLAWKLGCKGVTIYRDGSKENQVLSFLSAKKAEDAFMTAVRKRPATLEGFTTRVKTGLGQLYVTVTEYHGKPFEVFATIGKSGRSTTAKTEAIGRLVSLAFRSGVTVDTVVEQLKGIGGEHPIFQNGGLVLSIPDAIARVLEERYLKDAEKRRGASSLMGEVCPECGQTISFEEGCMTCHFCGYTKCG
ncbi:vitamin B12-dependent ribonucleotide reductase [Desulfosarcina ovata]|uniref:Vitamin B12-dependent ribonucleotide reductase n=1 Tax=Desulfosarcina ovata subsp. ovata TaxID=2752305 RepID=A0A5K8AIJ8_9BACT|nr:vitamin B12-dependent ribonucleotide reductase [Desulfosarcina ovata]BBO92513.1 ribonucleotide-diphosphate reductase subunit alpha [Desulfosarcina ovata subsp. ovata]